MVFITKNRTWALYFLQNKYDTCTSVLAYCFLNNFF